ncbi:MAG TPA: hypothetical protein VLZ29_06080 [Sulfurimonas sp.]|uniref:hypothetical protein n=1 Tax=Sulfurimonas sp. TaxID=2022749 RepID=UPI002CFF37EF|nr:hypothetical protein [Sulfurimonas sp.]HUH42667.1 hypothetical protein [Sulfurimonas sp.]
MSIEVSLILGGLILTFLTSLLSISSRFVRLESDVKVLKEEIEDFSTLKDMIYRIHAQNDVLLQMRKSQD